MFAACVNKQTETEMTLIRFPACSHRGWIKRTMHTRSLISLLFWNLWKPRDQLPPAFKSPPCWRLQTSQQQRTLWWPLKFHISGVVTSLKVSCLLDFQPCCISPFELQSRLGTGWLMATTIWRKDQKGGWLFSQVWLSTEVSLRLQVKRHGSDELEIKFRREAWKSLHAAGQLSYDVVLFTLSAVYSLISVLG